jgi:hypothetical protein
MNVSERTRTGLTILASGLALGILGTPSPANAIRLKHFSWIVVLAIVLVPWEIGPKRHLNGIGWLHCGLYAAALAGDSPTLRLQMRWACWSLSDSWPFLPGKTIQTSRLIEYGVEAAAAGFYALCGFPLLLFGDIEWKEVAHGGGWRRAIAVGRGILLALPLLFIFGGLLMAADAVFEGIVNQVLYDYFTVQPPLCDRLLLLDCGRAAARNRRGQGVSHSQGHAA